jgi:hypothetical protein
VYVVQKERESCEGNRSESGDKGLVDNNGELIADEVDEGEEGEGGRSLSRLVTAESLM